MNTILFIFLLSFVSFQNSFSQMWELQNSLPGSGTTAMKMNSAGDLFFTTASFNYPSGQSAGIYRMLNNTFIVENVNPASGTLYNCRTVEYRGSADVWASCWKDPSTDQEAFYYSSNKGNSWTLTYFAGASNNIFSIHASETDNSIYIGTRNGILKSTNTGINFITSSAGMEANSWTYDIAEVNGKLIAATSKGLYRSLDGGGNWLEVQGIPATDTPKSLTEIPSADGDKVVVGTDDGSIYVSDADLFIYEYEFGFDESEVIAMVGLLGVNPLDYILFVSALPNNLDVLGSGLYVSQNSPDNWINFGSGIPSPYTISAIAGKIIGNEITMFAGSFNNTLGGVRLYKTSYTVGISNLSSVIPEDFTLSQNYPNPFNPSTKIKFQVKNSSNINITVYNSLGVEISNLIDQSLNAGTYETVFNSNGLSSGVYFYRMLIDGKPENSITQKMLLNK